MFIAHIDATIWGHGSTPEAARREAETWLAEWTAPGSRWRGKRPEESGALQVSPATDELCDTVNVGGGGRTKWEIVDGVAQMSRPKPRTRRTRD